MKCNNTTLNDVAVIKAWNSTFPEGILQKKIIAYFEDGDKFGYSVDGYTIDLSKPDDNIEIEDDNDENIIDTGNTFQLDNDLPLIWYLEKDDALYPIFQPVRGNSEIQALEFAIQNVKENIIELITKKIEVVRSITYILNGIKHLVFGNLPTVQKHICSSLKDELAKISVANFLNEYFLDNDTVHSIILKTNDSFIPISIGIKALTHQGAFMTEHDKTIIQQKVYKNVLKDDIITSFFRQLDDCFTIHKDLILTTDAKQSYFLVKGGTNNISYFAGVYKNKKALIRFRDTNIIMRNIPDNYKTSYLFRKEPWTYIELNTDTINSISQIIDFEIQRNSI